jgi:hypothetical protein
VTNDTVVPFVCCISTPLHQEVRSLGKIADRKAEAKTMRSELQACWRSD